MKDEGKRPRAGGAAVATLVLALFFPASSLQAALIDRVVAAVNTDVITWSDLQKAVRFNEAMGGGSDREQLVSQTIEGLINRKLILQEAQRLKFVEVSQEEIEAEAEKLSARLGSEQALADFIGRLGMTRGDLDRMLGERLLVERFVEKKISLLARVRYDEALAYFEGHPDQFTGKRFPEVQKQIMAVLMEQKVGREVDEYVAELRSKADIRINPVGE
jgi:hypothetical protein